MNVYDSDVVPNSLVKNQFQSFYLGTGLNTFGHDLRAVEEDADIQIQSDSHD